MSEFDDQPGKRTLADVLREALGDDTDDRAIDARWSELYDPVHDVLFRDMRRTGDMEKYHRRRRQLRILVDIKVAREFPSRHHMLPFRLAELARWEREERLRDPAKVVERALQTMKRREAGRGA